LGQRPRKGVCLGPGPSFFFTYREVGRVLGQTGVLNQVNIAEPLRGKAAARKRGKGENVENEVRHELAK